MKTPIVTLVLLVSSLSLLSRSAEAVVPAFPIRNHSSDSTNQFEYTLADDKLIYLRSLSPDNLKTFVGGDLKPYDGALTAHLFDKLGFPYDKGIFGDNRPLLSKDETITEISVASEILAAVTDQDRLFIYKPTVLERPITWSSKEGAPFPGEVYLPTDRRAWSFSCSVRDKAIRRVDFMDPKDRVMYYSDQNGTKFDFGFTATLYVLLGDGQRIVYWDTGLAPSFSRGFLTPLKGATQGQSLSAAGSTIFVSVVDSSNKLRFFTRMYDYEINGACPGLTYTFKTQLDQDLPELPFALGFGQRKIPLEGWREHLTDGITKYLSSQVSIHLRGQGNDARELRIQGVNAEGKNGYYYKQMSEKDWQFSPDDRLKPVPQIPYAYNVASSNLLKDYEGAVRSATRPGFQLSLKSFHPFLTAEEPSVITVTYKGESADINLHTVDGWGLTAHKRHHEDLIGVQEGEPKLLQGTLRLNPEQLNCTDESPLCGVIRENFGPYHENMNSLQLMADNGAVYLGSNDGKLKLHFTRTVTQSEKDSSFFIKRAMDSALREAPKNAEHRGKLLEMNQKTLGELQGLRKDYAADNAKYLTIDSIAVVARPLAELALKFDKSDPTLEKATQDIAPLLKSHARMEWNSLKKADDTYQTAIDLLNSRITELSKTESVKEDSE